MRRKQTADDKSRELTEWYKQPLGQRLLEAEQELLDEVLPELFGRSEERRVGKECRL